MKKIILTAAVLIGITATAQVKVGANVNTLAAGANFQVEATDGTQLYVEKATGKVGVGTITPAEKLSVGGNINVNAYGNATITNPSGIFFRFGITPTSNPYNMSILADDLGTGVFDGLSINGSKAVSINTNNGLNRALNIIGNGNVGVATIAPSAKLEVNGNVKIVTTPTITGATKVLVKNATTNEVSEQAVALANVPQSNATAVATTPYQVVVGNSYHTTASTGVILVAPDATKWLITVENGGVLKTQAVTP